jgi:PAS domain S-box-containing protein
MPLSEDRVPFWGGVHPGILLLAGISITLILFGLVIWEALHAYGAYRGIETDERALDRMNMELNRLDESLSVAALLAVARNDSIWERRYMTTESRLDSVIHQAAIVLDTVDSAPQLRMIRQAHANRVETELKAMDLARRGFAPRAQIILSSDDYLQRKRDYIISIETALSGLNDRQEAYANSLRKNLSMIAVLTGGVVVAAWLSLLGVLQLNFRRRRMAEQILRESEARYRGLTEAAFDDIVLSENDIVLDASEKFARMFGYDAWDLKGLPIAQLVAPEYRDLAQGYRANNYTKPYELVCLRKDGSRFPVEVCGQSVPYHGRTARITAVKDIHERKQAEAERERFIHELKIKNDELERFTYTVSHDLKSPLITIGGFLKWVERDAVQGNRERMKTNIDRMAATVIRMEKLIDSLLKFSHAGHGQPPLEPVSLQELVEEAVDMTGGRIMQRRAQVRVSSDLPIVYGDRARLFEVVLNLLDNALKFMGDQPQPRIEIGTRPGDDGPVIYVRDNGIGIEPCDHEKVVGLFEKVDTTAEGSGVGLALVKRIIEQHRGSLWIESEGLGKGSTFFFHLQCVSVSQPVESS